MTALLLAVFALQSPVLYLHATEVNLRANSDRSADVLTKIRIGSECTAIAEFKDWVHVRCGDKTGWTLARFFEPAPPSFEGLLKEAEAATDHKTRLQAASRATALNPANARARELLRVAFFQSEHKLRAAFKKKRAEGERKWSCRDPLARCLERGLDAGGFKWQRTGFDDDGFVNVQLRGDRLHIARGAARQAASSVTAEVWSRGDYAATPELMAALEGGSASKEREKGLLDDKSARIVRALEGDYTVLTKRAGSFVIEAYCEAESAFVSVNRAGVALQPSFSYGEAYGQDGDLTSVLSASKSGKKRTLVLERGLQRGKRVSFEHQGGTLWHINGKPHALGGKGYPVEGEDCSYLDDER